MMKDVVLILCAVLCVSCGRAESSSPVRTAALGASLAGLGGAAMAGTGDMSGSGGGVRDSVAAVPAGRTLRVLSFNVREWTRDRDESGEYFWRRRMEAMRRMIEDVDPDVICLQEVLPPAGNFVPDGYRRVGVGVSHPIYVRDTMKASRRKAERSRLRERSSSLTCSAMMSWAPRRQSAT
ncbi:MAG: hypothetical protein IKZ72_07280, partial [Bacteroidales bacterium]|nr:hypothetical protein [Bacteroidales bacterium]